jgi:hypothetical protein
VDPQWPKTGKRGLLGSSADLTDPNLVSIANFQTVSEEEFSEVGRAPVRYGRPLLSRTFGQR